MHRNIQNSMPTVKIQFSSSLRGIYKFSKLLGFIFTHGWLSHSMSFGGCPIALTYMYSLTDSIPILFTKQFSLHPLLSIAFVQECSVVFRKVFWQGKTRKMHLLSSKWRSWKEFLKHLQRLMHFQLTTKTTCTIIITNTNDQVSTLDWLTNRVVDTKTQNYPKRPKMTQNNPKWSTVTHNNPKTIQHDSKPPTTVQNNHLETTLLLLSKLVPRAFWHSKRHMVKKGKLLKSMKNMRHMKN